MPVTVKEKKRRKKGTGNTRTERREYHAWGSSDGDAIEDAVRNAVDTTAGSDQAPAAIGGLPLTQYTAESSEQSEEAWDVTCDYAIIQQPSPLAAGAEEITFEVNPQTVHITEGKELIDSYSAPGKNATNHGQSIGVEGDTVRGTDIFAPIISFTINQIVPATSMNNAYVNTIANTAFKTNSAPFRGGAVGEVLYMGATARPRTTVDYIVSHKFLRGANLTGQTIQDITGIEQNAWENLWVEYQEVEDVANNRMAQQAIAAYRVRVYDEADLATALGLTA